MTLCVIRWEKRREKQMPFKISRETSIERLLKVSLAAPRKGFTSGNVIRSTLRELCEARVDVIGIYQLRRRAQSISDGLTSDPTMQKAPLHGPEGCEASPHRTVFASVSKIQRRRV
jgi:hypothetical protein